MNNVYVCVSVCVCVRVCVCVLNYQTLVILVRVLCYSNPARGSQHGGIVIRPIRRGARVHYVWA